ncbi:MAG: hypothetical protein A2284_08870 [Deltaproteobacteria bacterium RIFOXYA12_FULL_61_11]|nr:MAG: hypothetical protein A2284_08870 [Deltaproteobacteria bacterium RIFOXYA12_FULL_61_11]
MIRQVKRLTRSGILLLWIVATNGCGSETTGLERAPAQDGQADLGGTPVDTSGNDRSGLTMPGVQAPVTGEDPTPVAGVEQPTQPEVSQDPTQGGEPPLDGPEEPLPTLDCPGTIRALVLLDQRLYSLVEADLIRYVNAACGRRGFGIAIVPQQSLDDRTPEEVRALVMTLRGQHAQLEGVLYVGDVALPTYFKPRPDILSTRLFPRYLEDLDMTVVRNLSAGTVLPVCVAGASGATCRTDAPSGNNGSSTVPQHDYDWFEHGANPGPELWAAFLPVGYTDATKNTYEGYASQLTPFLHKALDFYAHPDLYERHFYHVGNDVPQFGELLTRLWGVLGPSEIDYYSVHAQGEATCKNNKACYVRAPLEEYSSAQAFLTYATALPWIGEGWQDASVFLGHLNGFLRRVVWWNTHGSPTGALLSSQQAKNGVVAGKGAAVALVSGCSVAGYLQPGSTAFQDLDTAVEGNLLVNLIYGTSAFVAALGAPNNRVATGRYDVLVDHLYQGDYLGMAHRRRLLAQDQMHSGPEDRTHFHELLLGDPFVDGKTGP